MKYVCMFIALFIAMPFYANQPDQKPHQEEQQTFLGNCWNGAQSGLSKAGHFTCTTLVNIAAISIVNALIKKYLHGDEPLQKQDAVKSFIQYSHSSSKLDEIRDRIAFFMHQPDVCSGYQDDAKTACKSFTDSLLKQAQKEYLQVMFYSSDNPASSLESFIEGRIAAVDWNQVCPSPEPAKKFWFQR